MTGAPQCIYEYGDHGGLLLLASHETEGPAERLQFSLDQGACWHNILLAEAIDIQNIRCGGVLHPACLRGSCTPLQTYSVSIVESVVCMHVQL